MKDRFELKNNDGKLSYTCYVPSAIIGAVFDAVERGYSIDDISCVRKVGYYHIMFLKSKDEEKQEDVHIDTTTPADEPKEESKGYTEEKLSAMEVDEIKELGASLGYDMDDRLKKKEKVVKDFLRLQK